MMSKAGFHPDTWLLVDCLREPDRALRLNDGDWVALITMARAETLMGTLAYRLKDKKVPKLVENIISDALIDSEYQYRSALWEVDCARRALESYDGPVVLMKGSAYAAAGIEASHGRSIGDLDIMVSEGGLKEVESLLIKAGWEWVKEDDYDDAYYRDYMHELPPLIHKERDRMIDVHHTILPKTAKPNPNALAMIADAIPIEDGHYIFMPEDMVCHCAAHLMADGDLAGGLRNLWDMHCLLSDFSGAAGDFWMRLKQRAQQHELWDAVHLSARQANALYGTPIPTDWMQWSLRDTLFQKRLLARNSWGQQRHKLLRFAFYIRSHWLRMPPLMLTKHLLTKWRKGHKAHEL